MRLWSQVCLAIDIFRWTIIILSALLAWRFVIRPGWEKYKDYSGW